MVNWYNKLKIARRGSDRPLMDQYSEMGSNEPGKHQFSITTPNPFFGGESRGSYTKNYSFTEENQDRDNIRNIRDTENTLMDQDPPTGEGANDDRFTLPKDKKPIGGKSQKLDKGGPSIHNMNTFNVNLFRDKRNRYRVNKL